MPFLTLTLLACDDPCADRPEGTPLPPDVDEDDVIDGHAAAAFDGETCSDEPPAAVLYGACEYLSDPTYLVPDWSYFDRQRHQDEDGLRTRFSAMFGAEALPEKRSSHCDTQGKAYEFDWFAEMSDRGSDLDIAWPGANRFDDGHLESSLLSDVQMADEHRSYAWLCLEALPPVDGLYTTEANWRGVLFLHSETQHEGVADFLVRFERASCVTAENTVDHTRSDGRHDSERYCTGDADGIDNDYDGIVDEGPDRDGDGEFDCAG